MQRKWEREIEHRGQNLKIRKQRKIREDNKKKVGFLE